MFNFREYNIADWFSFYRILAAPILLILLILDERFFFTWMFLGFVVDRSGCIRN